MRRLIARNNSCEPLRVCWIYPRKRAFSRHEPARPRDHAEAKYGFARTKETLLRVRTLTELISILRRDVELAVRDHFSQGASESWIPTLRRPRDKLLVAAEKRIGSRSFLRRFSRAMACGLWTPLPSFSLLLPKILSNSTSDFVKFNHWSSRFW